MPYVYFRHGRDILVLCSSMRGCCVRFEKLSSNFIGPLELFYRGHDAAASACCSISREASAGARHLRFTGSYKTSPHPTRSAIVV